MPSASKQITKPDLKPAVKPETKSVAKPEATSAVKVDNKQPVSKMPTQKKPIKQQYDEAFEDLDDDEFEREVPVMDGKLDKIQSKEWNPIEDNRKMKERINKFRHNYDDLTEEEKKLAEQELVFERNAIDNSFSQSDKHNQSSDKTPIKKESPPLNYKKKLTVVKEEPILTTEENVTSEEYRPKSNRVIDKDPKPRVNEKGETVYEFKEKDLPELDIETLAVIRDQLLLQKMYENDLKTFKKFKNSQKPAKRKPSHRSPKASKYWA